MTPILPTQCEFITQWGYELADRVFLSFFVITTILFASVDLDKGNISSPIWIKKKKAIIATLLVFIIRNSLSPHLKKHTNVSWLPIGREVVHKFLESES